MAGPNQLPAFMLDGEILRKLVFEISRGAQLNTAARKAGVKIKTLESWLQQGREGKDPYKDFAESIDHALELYEYELSRLIHNACHQDRPDMSVVKWTLERRFPKRWRTQNTSEEVIPVRSDGKEYTAEELRRAADIQEAAAARAKARLEAERKGGN